MLLALGFFYAFIFLKLGRSRALFGFSFLFFVH